MAKLDVKTTAGFNAGKICYAKPVRVSEIEVDPEFAKLFDIKVEVLEKIQAEMANIGFDKSQPVVLWGKILVDGHTRLTAAKEAGLEEIPAVEMEFVNRDAAMLYTIKRQKLRRNLSGADMLEASRLILEKHGEVKDIVDLLGVSRATAYQIDKVLKEADEEDIEAIKAGGASVKKVYMKTAEKNPKQARTQQKVNTPSPQPQLSILKTSSGNSSAIGFLQSAVSFFIESGLCDEAEMLTEHYAEYYDVPLEEVREELDESTEGGIFQ